PPARARRLRLVTTPPPSPAPAPLSLRSRRAWATLMGTIAIALFADLFTKWLAFERLAGAPAHVTRADVLSLPTERINALVPAHEPTVVVPHALELKLVLNPGAVFGL